MKVNKKKLISILLSGTIVLGTTSGCSFENIEETQETPLSEETEEEIKVAPSFMITYSLKEKEKIEEVSEKLCDDSFFTNEEFISYLNEDDNESYSLLVPISKLWLFNELQELRPLIDVPNISSSDWNTIDNYLFDRWFFTGEYSDNIKLSKAYKDANFEEIVKLKKDLRNETNESVKEEIITRINLLYSSAIKLTEITTDYSYDKYLETAGTIDNPLFGLFHK